MRRAVGIAFLGLVAIITLALLAAGYFLLPGTATSLSRREMLLGVLTLGVLAMAAFGFDLRDWI